MARSSNPCVLFWSNTTTTRFFYQNTTNTATAATLLIEEAEKYYFDEEDEFPMHYTAVLRYTAEVEMGDNDVDYGYMEKLAMDVDLGTSK